MFILYYIILLYLYIYIFLNDITLINDIIIYQLYKSRIFFFFFFFFIFHNITVFNVFLSNKCSPGEQKRLAFFLLKIWKNAITILL